jgi:hypothetical protein
MKCREHGHHHHHEPTKDALEFRSIAEFALVGPANFADGFLTPRDDGPFRALISNLRFSNPAT